MAVWSNAAQRRQPDRCEQSGGRPAGETVTDYRWRDLDSHPADRTSPVRYATARSVLHYGEGPIALARRQRKETAVRVLDEEVTTDQNALA